MQQPLIHVYFMPGMAANAKIFENIALPANTFKIHLLEWELPKKKETLAEYAQRFSKKITHANPVLVGVSFGGILVQEIAKHISTKKVIIISSVKSRKELPKRMIFAKYTKAHKLLPTGLVNNVELLAKYAFGETVTKRIELYEKFLSVRDKHYLDWSIDKIINWKQKTPLEGVVHVHGDKDMVFPVSHIKEYIKVKGGTHILVINRAKWLNEHLPELILS